MWRSRLRPRRPATTVKDQTSSALMAAQYALKQVKLDGKVTPLSSPATFSHSLMAQQTRLRL